LKVLPAFKRLNLCDNVLVTDTSLKVLLKPTESTY